MFVSTRSNNVLPKWCVWYIICAFWFRRIFLFLFFVRSLVASFVRGKQWARFVVDGCIHGLFLALMGHCIFIRSLRAPSLSRDGGKVWCGRFDTGKNIREGNGCRLSYPIFPHRFILLLCLFSPPLPPRKKKWVCKEVSGIFISDLNSKMIIVIPHVTYPFFFLRIPKFSPSLCPLFDWQHRNYRK